MVANARQSRQDVIGSCAVFFFSGDVYQGCTLTFPQFIVMFRSRFSDVFSSHLATFGPQELENDITDFFSGNRAETFLCALLVLILNRKQDIK